MFRVAVAAGIKLFSMQAFLNLSVQYLQPEASGIRYWLSRSCYVEAAKHLMDLLFSSVRLGVDYYSVYDNLDKIQSVRQSETVNMQSTAQAEDATLATATVKDVWGAWKKNHNTRSATPREEERWSMEGGIVAGVEKQSTRIQRDAPLAIQLATNAAGNDNGRASAKPDQWVKWQRQMTDAEWRVPGIIECKHNWRVDSTTSHCLLVFTTSTDPPLSQLIQAATDLAACYCSSMDKTGNVLLQEPDWHRGQICANQERMSGEYLGLWEVWEIHLWPSEFWTCDGP